MKMDTLPEYISPYMKDLIAKTGGTDGPIGKQFIMSGNTVVSDPTLSDDAEHSDPLIEAKHEVAPGMIYKYRGVMNADGTVKYHGRVLWTISRFCATYCRFCTRGRLVGLPANKNRQKGETLETKPYLSDQDIQECITFIKNHPEINEVILSGGDPLISPQHYFEHIVLELQKLHVQGNLDFIRIHTRAPITNPFSIKDHHFHTLSKIIRPHIVLHINHPYELTDEVLTVVRRLQNEVGAVLLSQSVLLKGVNDDIDILYSLFMKLAKEGIRPYYLHHNDPVYWAKEFTMPFKEAVAMWQELRTRISGIVGTAKFVIDTPYGVGKVVVPETKWVGDYDTYYDFNGEEKWS